MSKLCFGGNHKDQRTYFGEWRFSSLKVNILWNLVGSSSQWKTWICGLPPAQIAGSFLKIDTFPPT